jgi:hypothetical protein
MKKRPVSLIVKEMNLATLRCRGCDRFKTILCGDSKASIYIPHNATVLITGKDDLDDPALHWTNEDDVRMLFL